MMEELVKRLREASCGAENTLWWQAADAIENMSEAYDKLSRHMDDLAALMPRWIPVTERLPENGKYLVAAHFLGMENEPLLVSVADYAQSLESVDKYDFEGDNRPGWYCYDSEYGFYERKGIRFYMPLPEPPKEKPTCEDCQRECQMMGLDMDACASYKPSKEE